MLLGGERLIIFSGLARLTELDQIAGLTLVIDCMKRASSVFLLKEIGAGQFGEGIIGYESALSAVWEYFHNFCIKLTACFIFI